MDEEDSGLSPCIRLAPFVLIMIVVMTGPSIVIACAVLDAVFWRGFAEKWIEEPFRNGWVPLVGAGIAVFGTWLAATSSVRARRIDELRARQRRADIALVGFSDSVGRLASTFGLIKECFEDPRGSFPARALLTPLAQMRKALDAVRLSMADMDYYPDLFKQATRMLQISALVRRKFSSALGTEMYDDEVLRKSQSRTWEKIHETIKDLDKLSRPMSADLEELSELAVFLWTRADEILHERDLTDLPFYAEESA